MGQDSLEDRIYEGPADVDDAAWTRSSRVFAGMGLLAYAMGTVKGLSYGSGTPLYPFAQTFAPETAGAVMLGGYWLGEDLAEGRKIRARDVPLTFLSSATLFSIPWSLGVATGYMLGLIYRQMG